MSEYFSAMRGIPFFLQNLLSTTGNGNVLCCSEAHKHHNVIIKGVGAVGAGAVQLEEANDPDYTGTWSPITPAITVVADTEIGFEFEGIFRFIRARYSVDVTVGTASVTIVESA